MMRHTIVVAAALGLWAGMFPSDCPGSSSGQTVPEPTAAMANVAAGANRAVEPSTVASVAFDPNADPNLVAWWKLDRDATDSSRNGLHGKPVGDPVWVPGRIGGAVQLDGTDDCIDCGNPPQLTIRNELTMACWIKIEAFTRPWETILAKGDRSYRLSRAWGTSRIPYFACTGTASEPDWLAGETILAGNRWHHVAAAYDGTSMILYVDGREDARKPASGQIADTEYALCIGENAQKPGRFLTGLVDDVRIYNRALGAEEIKALVGPHAETGASEDQAQSVPANTGKRHSITLLLAASMVVLAVILAVAGTALSRQEQGDQEKALWQIVQKELLLSLMTFKFVAATVVCVVLTAVFVPMLAKDYQERLRTYRDNVARNEADLRTVKVYQNITPTVFRAPSVLSVFSEGSEKRIADAAVIELDEMPEIRGAASEGNPYQSVFPVFDTSLIFKIVLSILALLVAYDAVSGERERGTLKLMLSSATRRHQVLLAKLLAGLLVLVVPVTITFLMTLVILLSFPMISLSTSDWGQVLIMYIASLVFVSVMYNVGLLFSCLARRSPVSLVLGLFLWILFAVVVPNGSVYLAAELRPPEPQEKIDARIASLREERQMEWDENAPRRSSGDQNRSDSRDSFGRSYPRLLNRSYLEYLQESNYRRFPVAIKYADRFWEAERSRLDGLYEQRRLANRLSSLSPMSLYDGTMSALAETDLTTFRSFMDAVRMYRAQIIEYVRAKTDGFSSASFFTPCTGEEVEEFERLLSQARRLKSPAEIEAFYKAIEPQWKKRLADTPSLDLRHFPAFTMPGALGNVGRAIPSLVSLALVSMLFFVLALVAFVRYDVR
ncbi:MAG: ABC transporter permease subunit [Sedimentisphaerales bacterium]|nr:ABC transporter permease subunit [Sedimentisphaerales bacterium]